MILPGSISNVKRPAQSIAYQAAQAAKGLTMTKMQSRALDIFFRRGITDGWLNSIARLNLLVWGSAGPNATDAAHPSQSGSWNGTVTHTSKQSQSGGGNGYLNMNWNPVTFGATRTTTGLFSVTPVIAEAAQLGATDNTIYLLSHTFDFANPGWYIGNPSAWSAATTVRGAGVRIGYGTGTRTKSIRLEKGGTTPELENNYIPIGNLPNLDIYGMAGNFVGTPLLYSNTPFYALGILNGALTDSQALGLAIALDLLITTLRL